MDRNKIKQRGAALAATVIFHLLIILALVAGVLRYDSTTDQPEWPPADSSEILFGGEYVAIGDINAIADDTPAPPALTEATAPVEAATAPQPAPQPVVTTNHESPAKASSTPASRPDDKSRRDAAAAEQAKKRQQEAETSSRINDRVSFGQGKKGQPDGSAGGTAISGVSAAGLGNRKAVDLARPARGPLGRIVITIKVDRSGHVTSASFLTGDGAAAASHNARNSCIAAARRSRFSEAPDAPPSQTGTLTYNFK